VPATVPAHPRRTSPPRAFTLVELLILLALLALLLGILLPTLSLARSGARQLECASHLRQWGAAVHAYATGNDGYLPRRGNGVDAVTQTARPTDWFNALPPLMGLPSYADTLATGLMPRTGVWACAEAADQPTGYVFDYAMNMWLSTWKAGQPDRLQRLGDLATQVFMCDGAPGHCSAVPAAAPYSPPPRHAGKVNLCFLDGHVAAFTAAELGCGAADPLRPDVRWVVDNSTWRGPH